MADAQINAVRRELDLLVQTGLIMELKHGEKKDGKQGSALRKYYGVDAESILYSELQSLLVKDKTLGEELFLKELAEKAGDVRLLLLTGRFTGDKRAPSDMLIVGNGLKEMTVDRLVKKYEREFGSEINYTLMTVKEFEDRRHIMDKFLYSLFETKHVKVVNKLNV